MHDDSITSEHIVRTGFGIDHEKARSIQATLETRYPTHPRPDFSLRITPLSVGAWLIVLSGHGHNECDVLGCGENTIDIDTVLSGADVLVHRWRAVVHK